MGTEFNANLAAVTEAIEVERRQREKEKQLQKFQRKLNRRVARECQRLRQENQHKQEQQQEARRAVGSLPTHCRDGGKDIYPTAQIHSSPDDGNDHNEPEVEFFEDRLSEDDFAPADTLRHALALAEPWGPRQDQAGRNSASTSTAANHVHMEEHGAPEPRGQLAIWREGSQLAALLQEGIHRSNYAYDVLTSSYFNSSCIEI
uniref:Uncharacterized protein n=1 Tax=Fibrocapsa japonica TaxID=94617 RepID=A0A7S2UZK4_9STRA